SATGIRLRNGVGYLRADRWNIRMAGAATDLHADSGSPTCNTDRDFAICNTCDYRYAGSLAHTGDVHIHAGHVTYTDASTGRNPEWAGPGCQAGNDHRK